MGDFELTLAAILVAAVAVAAARLAYWRRQAGRNVQPLWRVGLILLLQIAAAFLLYRTLLPPRHEAAGLTLVVATRNAPATLGAGKGELVIALPEASLLTGAERAPDLATALRKHPGATTLVIVGDGLLPRDRAAAAGQAIRFTPSAPPRGLVRVSPPLPTAVGGELAVSGRVLGHSGATIELVDPSGQLLDQKRLDRAGEFVLTGTARVPGLALFTLRVRGAGRRVLEEADVPVQILADAPVRLLLVGAPGPETKYLRRWASDAGLALNSQLSAGGGVTIGDAALPISSATLREFDALILDERSWGQMPAADRQSIASAVRSGLGLILRVTALPSAAERQALRPLGFDFTGSGDLVEVAALPPAPSDQALQARRGPGTADAPASINRLDDPVAPISRWDIRDAGAPVSVLTDSKGATLASWHAVGGGRVGLWTLADSYALVLSGRRDLYFDYWSRALAAVARPRPETEMLLPTLARARERMELCDLGERARVLGPDGAAAGILLSDPATGAARCAAYWPRRAGFHLLVQQDARGTETRRPFYVHPAQALSQAARLELREATLGLTTAPIATQPASATKTPGPRGPAWPWFLAWLAASSLLWSLERRRRPKGDVVMDASQPALGT